MRARHICQTSPKGSRHSLPIPQSLWDRPRGTLPQTLLMCQVLAMEADSTMLSTVLPPLTLPAPWAARASIPLPIRDPTLQSHPLL